MEIINRILNSFVFWAAWIIIPLIMEIAPAVGSMFILQKRKVFPAQDRKPVIYPEITIIIPVYNPRIHWRPACALLPKVITRTAVSMFFW